MVDVRMRGFSELTSVDEALSRFLKEVQINRLPAETLLSVKALGRVLAEDVVCQKDVPPFDRSAVDGYAVRAEDVYGASQTNPVVLSIAGKSVVGVMPITTVGRQQAVRIATGAPLPVGADAVVMLEFTEETGLNKVEIYRPVTPEENVSKRGEDVKTGELILRSGTFLRSQDIAILAALGISKVKVTKRPRVAVLSTGDELSDLGTEASLGKIIDSNRPMILAMVEEAGGEPIDLGIAPDSSNEILLRLKRGLKTSDMVTASGATSVGEHDVLPSLINSLGSPGVIVHGMAMRPGRPTGLCAIGEKPILLLPGFPVAAIIAFQVFAHPIMLKMLGAKVLPRPTLRAKAIRRVPSSVGNRTFARVIVKKSDGEFFFEPLRTSGSGVISSMVRANGMVIIPENKEGIEEGETIEVTLLRPIEE